MENSHKFLFELDSNLFLEWVSDNVKNMQTMYKPFNWTYLGEYANNNAFKARNEKDILNWVRAGILIYKKISKLKYGNDSLNSMYSEMNLRVIGISKLGVKEGDDILDPHILKECFFSNLNIEPEIAKERSDYLKHLISKKAVTEDNLKEMRYLKEIKRFLILIKRLVDINALKCDDDIARWLELKDTLI